MSKIRRPYVVLGFILFLAAVPRLALASYLPILGDAGGHAYMVEGIMRTGTLPPDSMEYARFHSYFDYPAFFHLQGALFGFFVDSSYKLFPAIAGIITIGVIYLFVKELIRSEVVALFTALFAAVHPWFILFSSVFFMETTLIMFLFLTLWCHIKFVKTGKKSWLILTGLFLGGTVVSKQVGYFVPFILVIQHMVLALRIKGQYSKQLKEIGKQMGMIALISALVIVPFLGQFYLKTGTIFQPSNPDTNFLIFKSKVVTDTQAYEFIYDSGTFSYEHFDPDISPGSIIKFYSPGTYYTKDYSWFLDVLFLIFGVAGAIYMARRRPRIFLYLLVFLACYHFLLIILQTEKYFIQSKLIILVFIAASILFIGDRFRGKRAQFLSLMAIIILIITAGVLYADGIRETRGKYYSMAWLPTDAPITNLIESYSFVKEHSDPGDVIADQSYTEGIYYTGRETFWLRTSGGVDFYLGLRNHDEELVKYTFHKYDIRYLVIIDRFVSEGELGTEQSIRHQDYLFIQGSSLFQLVFEKLGVEVYEFMSD